MQRLQLERLQQTVARCYTRVPFYRQAMDRLGVRPDDIKSLADLYRLPFTKKTDLRENYPFGLFAEPLQNVVRIHASSGTKGKATVVGYTKNDIDMWAECCARAFCLAGGEPGDMFQNAYGYGLFTGGLGLHYGVERAGGTVVPVSGGNTPRQITLMQDFLPRGFSATPSYTLNICEAMAEMGIDTQSLSVRYGIFGAEPWGEGIRRKIEERLPLKAIDIYGLSEIVGPGVSCECNQVQDGLHVAEDHFLPEIVDPDTGAPVPDGQEGELVFTPLTKEAFPLLRYRTGDISSLNREPCSCGRTTVRMSRVKGRNDDMLIIRGVNVFPSEIERELLTFAELAPHYVVVLERRKALDEIEVQVEPADAVVGAWGGFAPERAEVQQLRANVAGRLKDSLGVTVNVSLVAPKTIARSEGKAVRVIDRREI